MNDLQYSGDQILKHCQDAENVVIKRNPDALQDLINAKLEVIRVLDKQIKAEK